MPSELVEPSDDDEVFDFDPDALAHSATMTGDVFVDVTISDGELGSVMIAGHPCTIRNGPVLKPRIPCVRVAEIPEPIPYTRWPKGHWNKFPIPEGVGLGLSAGLLDEFVSIDSSALERSKRKLTLTNFGVVAFQQRMVHSLTRYVAPTDVLGDTCATVLLEAELERDWVEARIGIQPVEDSIAEFHAFMDDEGRRDKLASPAMSRDLVREIRGTLKSE